jgi:hypothetical protein
VSSGIPRYIRSGITERARRKVMNVMLNPAPMPEATARFIAGPFRLLIDGEWVPAKSGKTFAVYDPSTGREIAKVAEGDKAVAAAL